jgi:hypothetical protein
MNKLSSFVGSGRGVLAIITFGAFASLACGAIPIGNSNVQIGGFFSQGYIASDGNNYPFEDNDGTFDFREMGVNASTTVGAHLRVGGQLFAQRLGDYGDDKVKLDWAVADYNFRQEFGIRLGRVKYPKGLYGEALDLDAIRPFIFLPMSLYNPVVRDFNSAFNGGMIYGSVNAAKAGGFDYKVFYGKIPMGPDQGVADFFNTTSLFASSGVEYLHMDYSAGGQLQWNTPVDGLKAVVSYSYLDNLDARGKFAAFPSADVTLHTDSYKYTTLSLEYMRDNWTLAAEWQQVEGDFIVINPFGPQASRSKVHNWYVSVARRLNDKFEVGTYFDTQKNEFPAAGSPSSANHNYDWALSLKYDLNEHVVIKIEGHTIDGTYNVFNTIRTPNPTLDTRTKYFAVKTTFSF